MKAPIIVYDGDVLVFESVKKAEGYLEPIDVERGDFVTYDSESCLLRVSVDVRSRRVWGFLPIQEKRVVIQEVVPQAKCTSELRQILTKYLSYSPFEISDSFISEATLDELIEKVRSTKPPLG